MILKSIIPQISLPLIKNIESHVLSSVFKKQFQVSLYTQRFSWICIHVWLVKNRMQNEKKLQKVINAWRIKRSLLRLMEDYTKDHVYDYQEHFDRSVYEELKRIQGVMFWSLDDYFLYDFKKKPIEQIIQEDLFLFHKKTFKIQIINQETQQTQKIKRQKNLQKALHYIANNVIITSKLDLILIPCQYFRYQKQNIMEDLKYKQKKNLRQKSKVTLFYIFD